MCGIAGFSNPGEQYHRKKESWIKVLDDMNRIQKHRGPDDEGTYLDD